MLLSLTTICQIVSFTFAKLGIQLRLFEITNTWVHGFGLMAQLESKLASNLSFKLASNLSFQFTFDAPYQFLLLSILLRYKWMTYGEAGTARSAIGSGLAHRGIPKASDL